MRRVTGPAAGIIRDSAEHEIYLGACRGVEDEADVTQPGVLQEPRAAILWLQVSWAIERRRKIASLFHGAHHRPFCARGERALGHRRARPEV